MLISEVHYKRLAKLGKTITELASNQHGEITKQKIQELRESIIFEVQSYEALLCKYQLQVKANRAEIEYYNEEMASCKQRVIKLLERSEKLTEKLKLEQIKRDNNVEYSRYVEEFNKPKKYSILKTDLERVDSKTLEMLDKMYSRISDSINRNTENTENDEIELALDDDYEKDDSPLPTSSSKTDQYEIKLAILDLSRAESALQNQELKHEISALMRQLIKYKEAWDERREIFNRLKEGQLNDLKVYLENKRYHSPSESKDHDSDSKTSRNTNSNAHYERPYAEVSESGNNELNYGDSSRGTTSKKADDGDLEMGGT